MPVDLSRVNVSLQQFQSISSGKYTLLRCLSVCFLCNDTLSSVNFKSLSC